ncbi:MAG: phosphopentomutase [Armatimonadetes bacterium]|nr:phosphopentomutase [Armatimonadota bacterium]
MKFDRVVCLVMDGCGAGAAPDAADFGDSGENEGHTLRNVWNAAGGFDTPLLQRLGILAAAGIETGGGVEAAYGRMREISIGKDTVTGHWEMMGIHLEKPLPLYPDGFPPEVIGEFEERIGRGSLGNFPASGTEIIQRLGPEHISTGMPIVYTSADSVFQMACHEDVVPVEELYRFCEIAREILREPHNVGRVIARPFIGTADAGFTRTGRRKDLPLEPPRNLVDVIAERVCPVFGIGVVPQVFAFRGFRKVKRTQNNAEHFDMLMEALNSDARFIWANFEDFDMLYGHRNDPEGFAKSLETFDGYIAETLGRLREEDLFILTADHGNDPTTPSTDHSREYVPIALWNLGMKGPAALGDMDGFWHVGAAVADALGLPFERASSPLAVLGA